MIKVTGPDWPTTRTLRAALAQVPQTGTIHWGASPCDKFEALKRLAAAGIPTPQWRPDCPPQRPGEVWLGRRTTHHSGRDILFPPSRGADRSYRELYASRDFYVLLIPSRREFRVHVWGEHADRMGFKQQTTEIPRDKKLRRIVRSSECGWQLCYNYEQLCTITTSDERKELRRLARASCAALGVVGGAVDILQANDGKFYVLELNTAPALGENTLDHYVRRICEWVDSGSLPVTETPPTSTTTPVPERRRAATVAAPAPQAIVWDDEDQSEVNW